MTIRDEIIDELLSGEDPQAVFAKDGLRSASWMPSWSTICAVSVPRRGGRRGATIATGTAARRC